MKEEDFLELYYFFTGEEIQKIGRCISVYSFEEKFPYDWENFSHSRTLQEQMKDYDHFREWLFSRNLA